MKTLCRWLCWGCLLWASLSRAQQPIIFFTDLIAGPNSGNSDTTYGSTGGVYVTLYGNFLDNFTSVKLNGASCLTVVSNPAAWRWYERMVVKIGTSCTTGNFSITTPSGTWAGPAVSSPNPDFTVTKGVIRYVATNGRDSNAGTFSSPWRNPYHAVQTLGTKTGNVAYIMAGTFGTTEDGEGWGAAVTFRPSWSSGSSSAPNGLVGYPGVIAQIGCESPSSCPNFAFRCTDQTGDWKVSGKGYWSIAHITARSRADGLGNPIAIAGGSPISNNSVGWRLIGLDVSSPNGTDNNATAFQIQQANHNVALGNWVHDLTLKATARLNQAMYASTDANYTEFGWNEVYNNGGRGGIQTHSSPTVSNDGYILHDLSIHDNIIHHIQEEGILLDTADPHQGNGVRVYNNVIYDAVLDESDSLCTNTPNECTESVVYQMSADFNHGSNIGSSPPPAWFYNNTVYGQHGRGVFGSFIPDYGSLSDNKTFTIRAVNNIFYSANSVVKYLYASNYTNQTCDDTTGFSNCPMSSGNNNLLYGNGTSTYPSLYTGSISADPMFVNGPAYNFHLQSSSSAIGKGLHAIADVAGTSSITAPLYDIDGRIRPNPPSIGAYEFSSGSSARSPNPPTKVAATVQ